MFPSRGPPSLVLDHLRLHSSHHVVLRYPAFNVCTPSRACGMILSLCRTLRQLIMDRDRIELHLRPLQGLDKSILALVLRILFRVKVRFRTVECLHPLSRRLQWLLRLSMLPQRPTLLSTAVTLLAWTVLCCLGRAVVFGARNSLDVVSLATRHQTDKAVEGIEHFVLFFST